jgi:putative resolvase
MPESHHDQNEQLQTQAQRLEQHCQSQGWSAHVITDLGSGMNYKKPGLLRLLAWVLQGKVERLALVTKHRLLRFGAELLFQMCRTFNVQVVILDASPEASREQQLTEDLVEILTVFSSRLYGSRSRKNLKAVAAAPA